MVGTLRKQDIELLADARHWDPFSVLGPHVVDINQRKAVAIRAVLPLASHAYVVTFKEGKKRRTEMERLHPDGVFEAVFPRIREFFPYRIEIVDYEGHRWQQDDPYAFGCVLTDFDIHLLHEGTHLDQYARLGSHLARVSEVNGVTFAVWAPNAERVSVVGNFNHWDGRTHPMRSRGESGIWEIFIPGLTEGEIYKFEIRTREAGALFTKSDPFAFRFEPPPRTGSRSSRPATTASPPMRSRRS